MVHIEIIINFDLFCDDINIPLLKSQFFLLKHAEQASRRGRQNKEKISSTALPLVEHFSLAFGEKSNHSRGVGIKGMTSTTQVKSWILVEAEDVKKHASELDIEVVWLTEKMEKQDEEIHDNVQLFKCKAYQLSEFQMFLHIQKIMA